MNATPLIPPDGKISGHRFDDSVRRGPRDGNSLRRLLVSGVPRVPRTPPFFGIVSSTRGPASGLRMLLHEGSLLSVMNDTPSGGMSPAQGSHPWQGQGHPGPRGLPQLSLVAFFAWVGLGADGLSSSNYGPEESFLSLGANSHLGLFVALATAITVIIISASYSQIAEQFPHGGGGYTVASKLLSPTLGMISGCALLIDFVLTITISIASGADAIFSFLPLGWIRAKLLVAVLGVSLLMIMNLRGVKESVMPLVPIFLVFLLTHTFAVLYVLLTNLSSLGDVAQTTSAQTRAAGKALGGFGVFLILMRAYSMGAGTYTGIEAVSNGMPILREPRVETAKKTMRYMAASLAFMAAGLMIGYLLFGVTKVPGKTLNAVLMQRVAAGWGFAGEVFVLVTLVSEAILLFVAAQAGFLGGPCGALEHVAGHDGSPCNSACSASGLSSRTAFFFWERARSSSCSQPEDRSVSW